jgi:hypothetical protein
MSDLSPWNTASTASHIAAWREAVHTFFTDDWERLRTMILELEAESWDERQDGKRPAALSGGSTPPRRAPRDPAAGAIPELHASGSNTRRLDELARSLKAQLNGAPSTPARQDDA